MIYLARTVFLCPSALLTHVHVMHIFDGPFNKHLNLNNHQHKPKSPPAVKANRLIQSTTTLLLIK